MPQDFVPGTPRKGFDGAGIFATDPSSGSPVVYSWAADMIRFIKSDNRDYPNAVDAAGMTHLSIPGVKTGIITVAGFMQPDRGFHTMLNTAFGPRTAGQLAPWKMGMIPWGGGAQIKAAGIWWNDIRIMGSFAQQGAPSRIGFIMNGVCCDPENSVGVADLTLPATSGVPGAGITDFIQVGYTDGQVSPTVYDGVRAFTLAMNNQLSPQPSAKSRTARIGSGYTPGPLRGNYALTQLKNSTQALPRTAGVYPQQLILPTGDASHNLVLDLACSYNDDGMSFSPNEFVPDVLGYELFYMAAGATTTGTWPMIASYS